MASVIVVDNDLKDSVREYVQVVDGLNGNTELATKVESLLPSQQDQAISNKSKLFTILQQASTAETLKHLTDKEFEPTVYLLIHILSQLDSIDSVLINESSPIYNLLLTINPKQPLSLRDRKSIRSTSVLSVLSTIFNLIPRDSKTRIYVIKQILKVIQTSDVEFNAIEDNISGNLVNCLKECNAKDDEIKEIFWNFIALDKGYSLKSLNFIKSFTHEFTVSESELTKLIKFALESKIVDVSFLVNNNVASALKKNNDKLTQLFAQYVRGETISTDDISAADSSLPVSFIHQKSRILNLARFFASKSLSSDHDDIIFKYSEIETASNSTELEELLVEAIKAGVLEGKINQIDETFYLSRVNRFILAGEDEANAENWNLVKRALQQWLDSIRNIDDIVKATRENLVKSSGN
ncbi:Eukaryotic translation initiation factor 3 subunit M [Candida parapsilosis]|nr:Eukaryotic translation initiation factor 3 subunit M [Candida parapsilosis]